MRRRFFSCQMVLMLCLVVLAGLCVCAGHLYAQQMPVHGSPVSSNPMIWADVPDTSVLRVGDTYYMSSTTMHLNPGLPIMYSRDLMNWSLASYAHVSLGSTDGLNLENGRSEYGRGSWASSLRFHDGRFYVSTFCGSTQKTYIYSTTDPLKGSWEEISFQPMLHDSSLFFDDDGKVYMVYGNHDIRLVELKSDLTGIQPGGINEVILPQVSKAAGENVGLGAEGSQIYKVNGRYYIFNITWPRGGMRTELVSRADKITGPYQTRVCMQDRGIAQGGIVDSPDGKWYAVLFQDAGAVGRMPYLMPVEWVDGWPVLGVDGKVPQTMDISDQRKAVPNIVASDEFTSETLNPVWQWNHNPDPNGWSLTARPGYLRLVNTRVDRSITETKNTLTQRTFGPGCSAYVKLDVSGLRNGDFAGLTILQKHYGCIGVQVQDGRRQIIVTQLPLGGPQSRGPQRGPQRGADESEAVDAIPFDGNTVYLRIDCDFRNRLDRASFLYSFDGQNWNRLGKELQMVYTLPHFMGYRYGLFNFGTQQTGGTADFDCFNIDVLPK